MGSSNPSSPHSGARLPSVLFNALPKSASTYVTDMLVRGLAAKRVFLTVGIFPHDLVLFDRIQTFSGGAQVAQQHFGPSPPNLAYLRKFGVRPILHLRDPRAAIVSWAHHLSAAEGGLDELFWYYPAICPPPVFLERDLPWRLAWCVENHLPHFVEWIEAWCDAVDAGRIEALFTTFEQLLQDRTRFFESILRFLDISTTAFADPRAQPSKVHLYRAGLLDEWHQILDACDRNTLTRALPDRLRIRFGW